jgi:DNA gyrase subunit A
MIADEDMAVTISHEGYIKRNPCRCIEPNVAAARQDRHDHTRRRLRRASLHRLDAQLHPVLHDRGKVYWIKVHEVPQAAARARGKAIVNLLDSARREDLGVPSGSRVPRESLRVLRDQAGRREEDRPDGVRKPAPSGSSRSVSIRTTR